MFLLIGFVILYNFYGSSIFTQINSSVFSDKFFMVIVFMSLGGMPPLLGFFSKILILKILINNFIRLSIIFGVIVCSLLLLYFYLSRIYFYLRNIPSLKTGSRLRKFSLKKTLYVISLIFFNS